MHGLQKFLLYVLTYLGGIEFAFGIIHGEKVPENSMLYMVSVQNNKGHMCGGFLFSEDFVVTAASCDEDKLTRVVLGTHNLKEVEQMTNIEQKFKPEAYKDVTIGADIMLLKLSRKAELSNRVQTIYLPCSEININEKQQCHVAGWGKTKTDGNIVDELRMADVSVINPQVCNTKWRNLPVSVICAGGFGTSKGFCQGDSGGPLVCNGIAVGVVSFNRNRNCDYPNVPNIYTDISKYLPWINSIVGRSTNSQSCMFCIRKLYL